LHADGKVIATWYGDVRDGNFDIGVLETSQGFEIGKFANGRFFTSDEYYRADINPGDDPVSKAKDKATERASVAAENLAKKFDKAGNKKSAVYYRAKAEQLYTLLN
jgi:hypothetical protein